MKIVVLLLGIAAVGVLLVVPGIVLVGGLWLVEVVIVISLEGAESFGIVLAGSMAMVGALMGEISGLFVQKAIYDYHNISDDD